MNEIILVISLLFATNFPNIDMYESSYQPDPATNNEQEAPTDPSDNENQN